MVFKQGKQNKKGDTGQDKPERISNRLDHRLIAESRQSIVRKWRTRPRKQRLALMGFVGILLVGVAGGVYAFYGTEDPPPSKPVAEPQQYDESTGSIIFEYKPKQ